MDDGRRLIPGALLLIGRDPAPAPAEQHATLVDVPDTELTVSKTHLSVLHEGRQLVVIDRGSTNGSVVVGVDGRERSLVPHQREVVVTGELVRFGDRSFRVVPVMEERS
jgi:pSer/pThr/pTyr-binding forkhead associated (FHA) protein